MRHVALTGMMGSGKSELGNLLASKLYMPFFDLDQEIEKYAGMPIEAIFSQKGEAYFRELEKEITICFLQKDEGSLLALGGGAVMSDEVRDLLKVETVSIWLNPDIGTLVSRLQNNRTNRPLIASSNDLKQTLTAILKERRPFYEEADIIFEPRIGFSAPANANILAAEVSGFRTSLFQHLHYVQ